MKKINLTDYQNVIILGEEGADIIIGVNYNNNAVLDRKNNPVFSYRFSKLPYPTSSSNNVIMNTLFVLNKYLRTIVSEVESSNGNIGRLMFNINVNPLLASYIKKGTYKYWVTYGKSANGKVVREKELNLWKEFNELYNKIFGRVNIYSLNNILSNNIKVNSKNVTFAREAIYKMSSLLEEDKEKKCFNINSNIYNI